MDELTTLLDAALNRRRDLLNSPDTNAFRLFNGFYEGFPPLCADLYADTLVLHHSTRAPLTDLTEICRFYRERLPQLRAILCKDRYAPDSEAKKGTFLFGNQCPRELIENGIRYPLNLRLNKDCGFYLDSAALRRWIKENAAGKRVLNTFAYTGSYGIAASAGNAATVCQTDINRNYLKELPGLRHEFIYGDFFRVVGAMKRQNRLFDLILLDPPFFSVTNGGKVNQATDSLGLLNKIRPLSAHEGRIVLINNALFLSGADFMAQIESACGEYLRIEETIPVPPSFYGGNPQSAVLPADPAPFAHPTKILVLRTYRKDGRK